MISQDATEGISLGDPVPWFSARTVSGATVALHVDAGRWVVLAFLGSLTEPRAAQELAELLAEAERFGDQHLVLYGVLAAPPVPEALAMLSAVTSAALLFIADYDGAIARRYGAEPMRRSIVLDPMQRAIANIPWDHPAGHAALLRKVIRELPPVADSVGVPLWPPALIVPRVFDFELCDFLVKLHDEMGGEESGFILDEDGKSRTVVDHRLKRRRDVVITDPQLRAIMRDRIIRRLVPAVDRFFGFAATRMDRYMVSCYDSALGGHFFRHRDNVNAAAQHRRFAVSINLSKEYEGCDLVFPEFGPRPYRAPVGAAIVFSCGMLHEVTPITRGRRHVFVPFLYGEADAALRAANNARLRDGEGLYLGDSDVLFPAAAE